MEYNLCDPAVKDNPYPYYAYLRAQAPVYQVAGLGCWAISRTEETVTRVDSFFLRGLKTFPLQVEAA